MEGGRLNLWGRAACLRPVILTAFAVLSLLFPFTEVLAQTGLPAVTVSTEADGGQTWSVTLQVLLLMTVLSLLPSALIMLTSFTRIVIVLGLLRQGMGTGTAPSNQVLVGMALFLTLFIMAPVFERVYADSIQPYLQETIPAEEALKNAEGPFRDFMLAQTRETDIALFVRISGREDLPSVEDVPFTFLVPAFVTSELKTAFQLGFLVIIPFLIIDMVVASVLMSLGMMMLSPLIVALPFKIMLFVLVDGWSLIMGTLAASFYS